MTGPGAATNGPGAATSDDPIGKRPGLAAAKAKTANNAKIYSQKNEQKYKTMVKICMHFENHFD